MATESILSPSWRAPEFFAVIIQQKVTGVDLVAAILVDISD
ncbi:MAG: hypothetical protein R3C05_22955 [Pirellulaceae bacterium]